MAPDLLQGGLVLGVVVSLIGEVRGLFWLKAAGKVGASAAFLALGHASPFIVALVLSAIGDVALLGNSKRALSVGIVAFIAAHLAYCVTFYSFYFHWHQVLLALPFVLLSSAVIGYLLWPHAGDMKGKAIAYMIVISLMVTMAAGVSPQMLIPAILFYISDVFVARQRFVARRSLNRIIGLPLYYAAQSLFARFTP